MNPLIPKLIRARYATNMIKNISNTKEVILPEERRENRRKRQQYYEEINLPIYEIIDGERKAANGRYVGRIFSDIEARTGQTVETNLRKRIMGITADVDTYAPIERYKQMIVDYLDFETWQEIDTDGERIYGIMLDQIMRREVESSLSGRVPDERRINHRVLNKGDIINLYMNKRAYLRLERLEEQYMFKVVYANGMSLREDDTLLIRNTLIRNSPIYAENRYCAGVDMGQEYLSSHHIIEFDLIEGEVTKQKRREREDARRAREEMRRIQKELGE